jgi:hypothetical protein
VSLAVGGDERVSAEAALGDETVCPSVVLVGCGCVENAVVYSADTGHSPGAVQKRPQYGVIEPPVVRVVLKHTAKLETSAVMWTEA